MRKEVVAFASILILTNLAARYLPGILDMPSGVVQETMMMVLLPIILIWLWWTW